MYLLPPPQHMELHSECFIITYDTRIYVDSALDRRELHYAGILKRHIEEYLCFSLPIVKTALNGVKGIILRLVKDTESLGESPEGYTLLIKEDGIEITGNGSEGLLFGVQTLRQVISRHGAVLPGLCIRDYPEIPNRGFYHDVTRGRIPTLESLKALADKMSCYKLNQLQLYVEHSFLFRDFSEVWRDDTPLTAGEILELDAYCRDLNIELVPSVASFGHLYKVLSTKTYAHLCELEDSDKMGFSLIGRMEHHTIDTTNGESFEVIKRMLLEYLPLFSSGRFNICADETYDLGKGKSGRLAEEIGADRLYVEFLKKLCGFIKAQGKRPMFWGDIILAHPEAIRELPEDVICLNWDYSRDLKEDNFKKLYETGVVQYLCPGVQGWNHFINDLGHAYDNISAMCGYALKYKAAGVLNTDWGDYGHINPPEFSTSGMIYGASFSWNSRQLPFEEINRQISALEYRDSSESFVSVIHELAVQDKALWGLLVEYKESRRQEITEELAEQAGLADDCLNAAMEKLYRNMSRMDSSKRNVAKAYLIMAKGMILFYHTLVTLRQHRHGKEKDCPEVPFELASRLEYWFMDYKELWRSGCKEGELYRIQEVVFWYADRLRELSIEEA